MAKANQRQVDGAHYRGTAYQHWDLVVDLQLEYLAANATKYLTRWRAKGGVADLEKALHYDAKRLECVQEGRLNPRSAVYDATKLGEFYRNNPQLGPLEREVFERYAMGRGSARAVLEKLLEEAKIPESCSPPGRQNTAVRL